MLRKGVGASGTKEGESRNECIRVWEFKDYFYTLMSIFVAGFVAQAGFVRGCLKKLFSKVGFLRRLPL